MIPNEVTRKSLRTELNFGRQFTDLVAAEKRGGSPGIDFTAFRARQAPHIIQGFNSLPKYFR